MLRREAASCTACDLYKRATQTVFGEGSATARMVLVGEQPGHEEDLAGRPFVGPAGRLLDEALEQAGVERRSVYITNAVKHFKWKGEEGGKRRIHDKPRQDEVEACRPWFDKGLWVIKPEGETRARPRADLIVVPRPITAPAAVAPRQTSTSGLMTHSSLSNHGRHASTSSWRGLPWIRRLPPSSPFHLKCLTAFVM